MINFIKHCSFIIALVISLAAYGKAESGKVVYRDIQKMVATYKQNKKKESLVKILKRYSDLYRFDTSHQAYDLIYPFYTKNRIQFKNLLNSQLSEKERKIIIFNLQGFEDEQKNGTDF